MAESRVRRADGESRWFLHRKTPLRNETGEIVRWYGSSIEIEERKTAEEKIRAEAALAETKGRVAGLSGAATRLGIPRQTLESKIASLGINKHRFKSVEERQSSLDIKMFLFTKPRFVEDVIAAHRYGVKARVMLNPARRSGESEAVSRVRYNMIRYTECGDPG